MPETPLSAYFDVRDRNQRAGVLDTQNLVGQMGLLQAIQKAQMEREGRGALSRLGPNATSDEVMAAMRPYVSPEHLFQWTQQAELKKATSDQTKQLAMSRLAQQIQRDAADIAHKARTATTAEEKFHWQQQMDVLKASAQRQAAEIAAGRFTFETGGTVEPFRGTIPVPSTAPVAPQPMTPTEGTGAAGIQPASAGGSMSGSPDILSLANRIKEEPGQEGDRAGALSQILAQQQGPAPSAPNAPALSPSLNAPVGGVLGAVPLSPTQDWRRMERETLAPAPMLGAAPISTGSIVAQTPSKATTPSAARPTEADIPSFIKGQGPREKWLSQATLAFDAAKNRDIMKADVNLMGGRESQQNNRIILGANEAVQVLKNIAELPISASSGPWGTRGTQTGIFNASMETLVQAASPQDVQDFRAVSQGLGRFLGAIETAGMQVPVTLMQDIEKLKNQTGMTNITKLRNMAEIRQIIEKGLEVLLANPRVPEEQKQLMRKAVDEAQTVIPFTQNDITRLQRAGATNRNMTLADIVPALKKLDAIKGDMGGAWTPEKEQRFQELKRKQSGGS